MKLWRVEFRWFNEKRDEGGGRKKKKTLLFRLGSKKLFREINFSPFQEGRNFQQLSSFWKITICWKLKGSRAVLFLLFFWSPVPTIAFPFRWCTKPSFNKFTECCIFEHSATAKRSEKFSLLTRHPLTYHESKLHVVKVASEWKMSIRVTNETSVY